MTAGFLYTGLQKRIFLKIVVWFSWSSCAFVEGALEVVVGSQPVEERMFFGGLSYNVMAMHVALW